MGVAGLILFSHAILWPFVSIFFCCCNNYHKLSALRKSKLIVLHFWRAEVQNPSHWSRFKMLARLTASRGSRGKVILCLFQFLEASSIPWRLGWWLHHATFYLHHHRTFSLNSDSSYPLIKIHVITLGPPV